MAPSVGDLLHAARFDEGSRIAAFGPDDLEQILGDLAGDGVGLDEVDDAAELGGETPGWSPASGLPCSGGRTVR
jgi:hypothetical protein